MAVAVVLEVWNEIIELGLGRLEGPSGRDVDAPNDLVDSDETGDVAALRGLLPYVLGPMFLDALFALSETTTVRIREVRTCSIELGLPKLQPF